MIFSRNAYAVHFFLLGAFAGALSELFNGIRTGLSSVTKSHILAYTFIIIYGGLLLIVPHDLFGTFPFLSSISITIGMYFFSGVVMRVFIIAGFFLWLIYSIKVFSIGGIIAYSILLITHTTTIFRLIGDDKKKNETNL